MGQCANRTKVTMLREPGFPSGPCLLSYRMIRPTHRRPRVSAWFLSFAALALALTGCERGPTLDPALASAPLPGPGAPIDQTLADAGAWYFRRNCSACHHLGEGAIIGPDLAGVTRRRPIHWIAAMIRNPDSMLVADTVAAALLAQYQVPMANRQLDHPRILALLEFLRRADAGPPPDTRPGTAGASGEPLPDAD